MRRIKCPADARCPSTPPLNKTQSLPVYVDEAYIYLIPTGVDIRRRNKMSKIEPRTSGIKIFIMAVDP